MSYASDEMISAEDGPELAPPRTRDEWAQLAASLDVAYRAPTLAALPDWSTLAKKKFSLPAALREAAAFSFDWGTITVGDPIVAAALSVAELSERLHDKHGARYRCDACLDAGAFGSVFDWAGALFVHLLTCKPFARAIALEREGTTEEDVWETRPDRL